MQEIASSDFSLRFALLYLIGLAPGLLVRFAWKRQPVAPALATAIAGISCVLLFVLSRPFVEPADPDIVRSGFMWALLFIVNRSVMIGGRVRQPAPASSD